MLFLIIGRIPTSILGDKTILDEDFRFVISNATADTIFVEETDSYGFLMIEPKSKQIYRFDHVKVNKSGSEFKWPIKEILILVRNNDTSTFAFYYKNSISITTDENGNKTVTRVIK